MGKLATNQIKRLSQISNGTNKDASDEYYTLFHTFSYLLIELIARHKKGITYKKIVCPCDGETSIFRSLTKYTKLIGEPELEFSSYPNRDWKYYFQSDKDTLILTNPPFKGLSKAIAEIECDYLLVGSKTTSFKKGTYCKLLKGYWYYKNNDNFISADKFDNNLFGAVKTCFYSNIEFVNKRGEIYTSDLETKESLMFGKDKLKRVDL